MFNKTQKIIPKSYHRSVQPRWARECLTSFPMLMTHTRNTFFANGCYMYFTEVTLSLLLKYNFQYFVYIKTTTFNLHVILSAVYLAVTLCLGVVCCLLTVLVIRINFRDPDTPVTDVWKRIHDNILVPCSCSNGCFCRCKKGKKSVNPIDPKDELVVMNYDGEKNEPNPELEPVDELKWTHVATLMDHFFLVVMVIITTISSTTFMVALSVGGAVNQS